MDAASLLLPPPAGKSEAAHNEMKGNEPIRSIAARRSESPKRNETDAERNEANNSGSARFSRPKARKTQSDKMTQIKSLFGAPITDFSLSLRGLNWFANLNSPEFERYNELKNNNSMKTNYEIRYAAHPEDAKQYDTARLRRDFLIEKVFAADEVNMVYSMYDRMVVGGAMPVAETLRLEAIDPLKAPFFLTRREMGIYNVGGEGIVKAGDAVFELGYKEALYLGSGDREVTFESKDAKHPAKFYFNSLTAHRNYPDRKVTKADAVVAHMGSLEGSNDRNINKMLVNQVLPTCQLQMGMTELLPGSVWNTMPAHVHSRRMEAYFYFEVPEDQAVCHFMGQVDETRHIWMKGDQAVLSPEWSIHSAAATHNYTFIWGMGGENLDYGDQDFSQITDLR